MGCGNEICRMEDADVPVHLKWVVEFCNVTSMARGRVAMC